MVSRLSQMQIHVVLEHVHVEHAGQLAQFICMAMVMEQLTCMYVQCMKPALPDKFIKVLLPYQLHRDDDKHAHGLRISRCASLVCTFLIDYNIQ